MNKVWHINDLIDLEYFMNISRLEPESSASCERDLCIGGGSDDLNGRTGVPRRLLLRWWLDMRRADRGAKALPGDIYKEGSRMITLLFFVTGTLAGAGLGASLLSYDGTTPVNVATWLGVTTLTQIGLLFILTAGGLLKTFNLVRGNFSILHALAGVFFLKSLRRMGSLFTQNASAGLKNEFAAALGILGQGKKIYGSVFYWQVFIIMQLFGAGFNLGILVSTSLTVAGSDIAFGWQSTVQVSSHMLHGAVKLISLPWAWFAGAFAHPSFSQIEGSRMVLKDGMFGLMSFDLAAWWPFLCLTLLFYGMLPRLGLLCLGLAARRRALNRLDFSHNDCDRIIHRLTATAPNIENEHSASRNVKAASTYCDQSCAEDISLAGSREVLALIPGDLACSFDHKELDAVIQGKTGGTLYGTKNLGDDFESDIDSIRAVLEYEDGIRAIVVLQEAWMPPIREFLNFMEKIRACMGEGSPVIIGLIGKPRAGNIFTEVDSMDWKIWNMKLNTLGDPWTRAERFGYDE